MEVPTFYFVKKRTAPVPVKINLTSKFPTTFGPTIILTYEYYGADSNLLFIHHSYAPAFERKAGRGLLTSSGLRLMDVIVRDR